MCYGSARRIIELDQSIQKEISCLEARVKGYQMGYRCL